MSLRSCLFALSAASLLALQGTSYACEHHGQDNGRDIARRATGESATDILSKAIEALGGQDALESMKSVQSHASIFRTFSLGESFSPGLANTAIESRGERTVSYDLSDPSTVVQRIDRTSELGDYWTFFRPNLEGVDASLITKSGSDGYACFNKGNTLLFAPNEVPAGYVDPNYANVLVRDAWRISPALLLAMQASNSTTSISHAKMNSRPAMGPNYNVGVQKLIRQASVQRRSVPGVTGPAIHDAATNLTVIFDPETYLPTRVRAHEDHQILGSSTSDYVLYNYTETDGIMFARNIKLMYNSNTMLQEILYDNIIVNPTLSDDYFAPLPVSAVNQTLFGIPPTPALQVGPYSPAEVFENTQNMFWGGGYNGTEDSIKAIKPIPGLDNLYHLTVEANSVYRTVVAVFDDAIMVTDAPPHQSLLIIDWIKKKFDRPVTHLLISHHHHDHNYGASDYVAQGAKLVVPEDYQFYWEKIPGVQFETSSGAQPFVYKDGNMQVRGVWHQVNAHAADWQYFTFTEACPDASSPMGVVTADGWSPGYHPWDYGQQAVVDWLGIARADRVAKDNIHLPIHGEPTNSSVLYEEIGYAMPDYTTADFLPGGTWC